MLVDYARLSMRDQNPDLQLDALRAAVCEKILSEQRSSAQRSVRRAPLWAFSVNRQVYNSCC